MRLVGSAGGRAVALEALPGKVNYLRAKDPSRWERNLPTYSRVRYEGVYPGIDVEYHGNQRRLEYDFVVNPGARAGAVRLAFGGAQGLRVDGRGNLKLKVAGDEVEWLKPVAYQTVGGQRRAVPVGYALARDHGPPTTDHRPPTTSRRPSVVAFRVGAYDRRLPLVIDPVLAYSSFIGGTGDDVVGGVDVDGMGNAYLVGYTTSADFPLVNPYQSTYDGRIDAFVAKVDPTGTKLIYSTYLGGSDIDIATGSTVRAQSVDAGATYRAVVAGYTSSTNFPVTANATQSALKGSADIFVSRLTQDGSGLDFSTYLGGSDLDFPNGAALDGAGNVIVAGGTLSSDFPTKNAVQPALNGPSDVIVSKINLDTGALVYSTYLGGSLNEEAYSVALDADGNAYVGGATRSPDFPILGGVQASNRGGFDGFVVKLSSAGIPIYSTYLGGSANDFVFGIAVDSQRCAYVTGWTFSSDFWSVNAFQPAFGGTSDAFVAKLAADGGSLVYSSYLGGSGADFGLGIAVDGAGHAFVGGGTNSLNFPVLNAIQATYGGGQGDGFVAEVGPAGNSLVYSTYLGGTFTDEVISIALDSAGNAYVAGRSASTASATDGGISVPFPTTPDSFQPGYGGGPEDGFIAKIGPGVVPALSISGRVVALDKGVPLGVGGAIVNAGGLSATTALNGAYTISGLAPGTYAVTANLGCYATGSPKNVTVPPSQAGVDLVIAPLSGTLVVSPAVVIAGSPSVGTVTLSSPAPPGGLTVPLSSSNAAASVPASVFVAEGSTMASFPITTNPVNGLVKPAISAQFCITTNSVLLTVGSLLQDFHLFKNQVQGGASAAGIVTLLLPAPPGGTLVTITNTNPAVKTIPSSFTIAEGKSTGFFVITTKVVNSNTTGTVSVTVGPRTMSDTLTVTP